MVVIELNVFFFFKKVLIKIVEINFFRLFIFCRLRNSWFYRFCLWLNILEWSCWFYLKLIYNVVFYGVFIIYVCWNIVFNFVY